MTNIQKLKEEIETEVELKREDVIPPSKLHKEIEDKIIEEVEKTDCFVKFDLLGLWVLREVVLDYYKQAQLLGRIEQKKEDVEMFEKIIDERLKDVEYSIDNSEEKEFDEEYERDEYIQNLYGMKQALEELKDKLKEVEG